MSTTPTASTSECSTCEHWDSCPRHPYAVGVTTPRRDSVEVRELGGLVEVSATYAHAPDAWLYLTRREARELAASLVGLVDEMEATA